MPRSDGDAIRFGERLLALLDYGSFTATYKYAVLLALLDLCLEHAGRTGEPPSSLTTIQLAEKVVELYWPQTVPFAGADRLAPPNAVLRQNTNGQAEIVSLILRFRRDHAPDAYGPLHRARITAPTAYHRLIAQVEWKLVEMPLPRLQQLCREHDPFIYQIGWDATVKAGQVRSPDFDNRILLLEGAGEHLVRLAPLIRPLAHRKWTSMVARINRDVVHESHLEDFLFGTEHGAVARLAPALRELQDDRCFYCASSLAGGVEVDHFLPWSRFADDGIENLVAAHRSCNNSKRDFLAAEEHVAVWVSRFREGDPMGRGLAEVAERTSWQRSPGRTLSVARAIYLNLPPGTRLWSGIDVFAHADHSRLERMLG
jgi:hypothetical protein